jgi:P27 family predicted phage terminase small subunit
VIEPPDRTLLAAWCVTVTCWKRAVLIQRAFDEDSPHPLLIEGPDGQLRESPLLRLADTLTDLMLRLGGELGFTPASRARLRAVPTDPANDPAQKGGRAGLHLVHGGKDQQPDA